MVISHAASTMSFMHVSETTLSTLLKPSSSGPKQAIFTTHNSHDCLVFNSVSNKDFSCHHYRLIFHVCTWDRK